jgi:hypothetical protein
MAVEALGIIASRSCGDSSDKFYSFPKICDVVKRYGLGDEATMIVIQTLG